MKPRPLLAAAFLAAAFGTLYFFTPTRAFSYDGLCYALDVDFSPWVNLFHPNHLLYSVIGRLVVEALAGLGWPLRALPVLQGMNAVVGGIAVGVLFWVLERDLGWRRAFIGAGVLAVSGTFWTEVVDPGCYAWTSLAGCFLLGVFLSMQKRPAFQTGLWHGAAVLFHQMFVLMAPAFLWRLRREWAGYLAGLALAAGAGYGAVTAVFHLKDASGGLMWIIAPAGAAPGADLLHWWTFNPLENAVHFWQGLVPVVGRFDAWPGPLALLGHAVMLALIGWGVWESRCALQQEDRRELVTALWIGILSLSVFHFFHLAGADRFWLPLMPSMIYLGLFLTRPYSLRWFYPAAAGLVLLGGLNFYGTIAPRARGENNPSFMRALWVSQVLKPETAFLFGGDKDSIVNVYVAYFAPHVRGRSVRGYFLNYPNGDLTELDRWAAEARKNGRPVYLEKALFDPLKQQALEQDGNVPPGTLARWLSQFKTRKVYDGPGGYQVVEAELLRHSPQPLFSRHPRQLLAGDPSK
jgi:hypothetical protein